MSQPVNRRESRVVRLGPDEWPARRPFADPSLVNRDCEILIGLIRDLNAAKKAPPQLSHPTHGRDRLIVTDSGRVHGDHSVTVVGFFGERNATSSDELADQVEDVSGRMVAQFADFPLLLGYVSRMLDDGFNYANLVVLAGSDAIDQWRDLARHVEAADELAPRFYNSVRIYNGELPNGLRYADQLLLHVVKYWDYGERSVWHATRRLATAD